MSPVFDTQPLLVGCSEVGFRGILSFPFSNTSCINLNYDQHDATFLDLFISTDAVHVSGGSSAHHQEHITVYTASGIANQYCCWLLSWMRWNGVPSHLIYEVPFDLVVFSS